jgi:surface polysaccharide O-acyltransferase-like enzyme
MRIFAILAVILIHTIAPMVLNTSITSNHWMLANAIDSFVRWCVPVFIMLSGALVIKPSSFEKRSAFLKHKVSRIALAIIVWSFAYSSWLSFKAGTRFNVPAYISGLASGSPAPGHLYFLFIILGLYVLTPLISLLVKSVKDSEFSIITYFIMALTLLWFLVSTYAPGQSGAHSSGFLTQSFAYVGYFMLGYSLKSYTPKRPWLYLILFTSSYLLLVAVTQLLSSNIGIDRGLLYYSYISPFVILMSVCVFVLTRYYYMRYLNKNEKLSNLLVSLSTATFGVYLIHIFIMGTLIDTFRLNQDSYKHLAIIYPATILISYGISYAALRIPYLRRLFA